MIDCIQKMGMQRNVRLQSALGCIAQPSPIKSGGRVVGQRMHDDNDNSMAICQMTSTHALALTSENTRSIVQVNSTCACVEREARSHPQRCDDVRMSHTLNVDAAGDHQTGVGQCKKRCWAAPSAVLYVLTNT